MNDLPGGTRRQDALIVEIGQHVAALGGVDSAGWSSIVPLAMTSNERFRVARGDAPAGERGIWVVAKPARAGLVRGGPGAADRRARFQLERWAGVTARGHRQRNARAPSGTATPSAGRFDTARSPSRNIVGVVRDGDLVDRRDPRAAGLPGAPTVVRRDDADAARPHGGRREPPRGCTPISGRWRPGSCRASGRCAMRSPLRSSRRRSPRSSPGPSVSSARSSPRSASTGLISYLVVQRSRELAIRRAIGARTSHIFQVLGGSSLEADDGRARARPRDGVSDRAVVGRSARQRVTP